MTKQRIKAGVALVLMVAAFSGANAWKATTHLTDSIGKIQIDQAFPSSFGDWVVDNRTAVQLVSPDQQEIINRIYNQTLSRTYVNRKTGQVVMLSVAYGGDQSDATRAHRPEVCYPAQGFQIVESDKTVLAAADRSVPARRLVARMGARNEPITYWVITGDKISVTGTEQKLTQLSYSMRGVIPDGMLVRVSNIDVNAPASFALHAQFISEMAAAVPGKLKERIFGAAGTPTSKHASN